MDSIREKLEAVRESLPEGVTLVAVSKTHPAERVMEAYDAGQRDFGENRPQEMVDKHALMPEDVRWHQIGHLQTNKVKYIAPFVTSIQSVDSERLIEVIDREAIKNNRVIDILLEVHVAREQTKSGWDASELRAWLDSGKWRECAGVRIRGLMTIASLTDDTELIRAEFGSVRTLFEELRERHFGVGVDELREHRFDTLSMGMTSDYRVAIECGATMVRIGSLIFGRR